MAYTFQTDSNGNVIVYQNGTRITTTTPAFAASQYGYSGSAPAATATPPATTTSTSTTAPATSAPSTPPAQGSTKQAPSGTHWSDPYGWNSDGTRGTGLVLNSNNQPVTQVTLGNGQSAYIDNQGNYFNAQGSSMTDAQVAASTASTTPPASTTATGTGLAYDPSWSTYGIDQNTWNQMSPTQQGVVGAALTAAKGLYAANASNVTLNDALAAAATDPNLVAKYADAAKLDAQTFTQSLQQLQTATSTNADLQRTAFENERKQLAEASAAAGQAYSGFRGKAQEQLAQSEQGIVTSSRAQLQKNLQDLTTSFEAKYGTGAAQAATTQFVDPYAASGVSLSGLSTPKTTTPETLSGTLAGGITGSEPIAKKADILNTASQYVSAGQIPTVTPA